MLTPTVVSDGVNPGFSALVESESRSLTPPLRLAISPISARSVLRPSTGVRSSLKSPLCRIVPAGVWYAVANACGTECVTGMNSQSNGPIMRRSPSCTGISSVRPSIPASSMRFRARPSDERRPVDRERDVTQQEGQPAGVVLVRVGEEHRLDPVGVLPEVREVGEDEVDARHVGLGEHDPAVDDQDAVVDLEAEAVAPDLTEPAEEDDLDRR